MLEQGSVTTPGSARDFRPRMRELLDAEGTLLERRDAAGVTCYLYAFP